MNNIIVFAEFVSMIQNALWHVKTPVTSHEYKHQLLSVVYVRSLRLSLITCFIGFSYLKRIEKTHCFLKMKTNTFELRFSCNIIIINSYRCFYQNFFKDLCGNLISKVTTSSSKPTFWLKHVRYCIYLTTSCSI